MKLCRSACIVGCPHDALIASAPGVSKANEPTVDLFVSALLASGSTVATGVLLTVQEAREMAAKLLRDADAAVEAAAVQLGWASTGRNGLAHEVWVRTVEARDGRPSRAAEVQAIGGVALVTLWRDGLVDAASQRFANVATARAACDLYLAGK